MISSTFFGISTVAYIIAMIVYIVYLAFKNKNIGIIATAITIAGFISQTLALALRWIEFKELGQLGWLRAAPLTNLYESLIFFVWCLILVYLVIEFRYKNRSFGAFITPIAGLALAFIEMSGVSKDIQPLVPALQSNWLLAHVLMSFIAYALFAVSFSTGLMYLIVRTEKKSEPAYIFWSVMLSIFIISLSAMGLDFAKIKIPMLNDKKVIENALSDYTLRYGGPPSHLNQVRDIVDKDVNLQNFFINPNSGKVEIRLKSYLFKSSFLNKNSFISVLSWFITIAITFIIWNYGSIFKRIITGFNISREMLDEITYKSIAIGFPIFTLGGLIFGAVWADQAWGKYWTWDPKETWSLITWFFYAFYLHSRLMRGWKGTKVAIVAVLGFLAVIFTYLGVNLLLSGLHSYGGQ